MRRKGELTKQILITAGAGLAITTMFLLPGSGRMFLPFLKKLKTNRQNFIKSLKTLKRDRLVDFREQGDVCKIILTEKGKKKLLEYNLDRLKIKKPKKWDKIWRIVTFDIPEARRPARDALRSKLKEIGFYPLHKSVFIHPYPCENEIQFIEEIFKIGPYINFIEAHKIEGDDWLRSKFDLS